MKVSDVIGKRITAVRQMRYNLREHYKEMATVLVEIELENGTLLRPHVRETDFGEYAVQLIVAKPRRVS